MFYISSEPYIIAKLHSEIKYLRAENIHKYIHLLSYPYYIICIVCEGNNVAMAI